MIKMIKFQQKEVKNKTLEIELALALCPCGTGDCGEYCQPLKRALNKDD